MSPIGKILCLICVLNVFKYGELQQSKKEECTTPDSKSGKCVAVANCKTMLDFLKNAPKPVTVEVKNKLNEYVCAFESNVVKVCCPSDPIELIKNEDPDLIKKEDPDEPVPPPPDVSNHKNVHLLEEECGLIDIGDKIRNGINAKLREFPWMALLSYNTTNGPQFKCGGTIINDRYILTAAHCLAKTAFPLIGVRVGEYDLSSVKDCDEKQKICLPPYQDLAVEDIIIPTDYNLTLYSNDVALIRVSKIKLSPGSVIPVCLPVNEEIRNQEFKSGVVTGWGFTDAFGSTTDILQRVELPTQPLSQCIESYKVQPEIKLSYKHLCIGGTENKDSCRGDSGGPFHAPAYFNDESRYVQQGIVSIGPSLCGTIGFPGVYTKVAYYMPWILDNIKP